MALSAGGAWRAQLLCVALIAVVAAPLSLGIGGGAARPAFALAAFLIAGALVASGRVSLFLVFVLWLFALTPLIRRLIDYRLGWSEPNLVLLAPYLAAIWSAFAIPTLIHGRRIPLRPAFVAILVAVGYGLVLAVARGRVVEGVLDALLWGAPPCLAVMILASDEPVDGLFDHIEAFFSLAVLVTAAYGIQQFFAIAPWDAVWMVRSEMPSIGVPEPFEVRIFSTMNSPGPFAFLLVAGLLTMVGRSGPVRLAILAVGTVALGLTMVRAAWLGLAVGLLVLLVVGSGATRRRLAAAAAAVGAGVMAMSAHPQMGPLLNERLTSLANVANDTSAIERWQNYALLGSIANDHVFGQGLAVGQTFTEADGQHRAIDSGLIEIVFALGVPGATLYLGAIGAIAVAALLTSVRTGRLVGPVAAAMAIGASSLSGQTTVGVVGVLFFVSLAVVLAHLRGPTSRRRPRRRAPGRAPRGPPSGDRARRPSPPGDARKLIGLGRSRHPLGRAHGAGGTDHRERRSAGGSHRRRRDLS